LRFALALIVGTALCAPAFVAQAQTAPAAAPSAYKPPRLSDGHPDLQGFWSNATLTPMTRKAEFKDRAVFSEDEVKKLEGTAADEFKEGNKPTDPNSGTDFKQPANTRPEFAAAGGAVGGYNTGWLDPGNQIMRVNGQPRTSILTTPNGQYPARKANVAAAPAYSAPAGPRREGASMDYETRSSGERCVIGFGRNGGPPMLSNGFYNNDYQIIQSPKAIAIEVEMNHDTRIIRMNEKHRTDDIRPYFGDSIGWWEGDTLVVETDHIPRSQSLNGSWEHLKVTERFTRTAPNHVDYKFTVEDPTMWDAAWGGEYEFSPMSGVIYEYACHEGNYALPGILSGNKHDLDVAAAKAAAPAPTVTPAADAKPSAAPAKPAAKPAAKPQ
jgi:hypothetical protein